MSFRRTRKPVVLPVALDDYGPAFEGFFPSSLSKKQDDKKVAAATVEPHPLRLAPPDPQLWICGLCDLLGQASRVRECFVEFDATLVQGKRNLSAGDAQEEGEDGDEGSLGFRSAEEYERHLALRRFFSDVQNAVNRTGTLLKDLDTPCWSDQAGADGQLLLNRRSSEGQPGAHRGGGGVGDGSSGGGGRGRGFGGSFCGGRGNRSRGAQAHGRDEPCDSLTEMLAAIGDSGEQATVQFNAEGDAAMRGRVVARLKQLDAALNCDKAVASLWAAGYWADARAARIEQEEAALIFVEEERQQEVEEVAAAAAEVEMLLHSRADADRRGLLGLAERIAAEEHRWAAALAEERRREAAALEARRRRRATELLVLSGRIADFNEELAALDASVSQAAAAASVGAGSTATADTTTAVTSEASAAAAVAAAAETASQEAAAQNPNDRKVEHLQHVLAKQQERLRAATARMVAAQEAKDALAAGLEELRADELTAGKRRRVVSNTATAAAAAIAATAAGSSLGSSARVAVTLEMEAQMVVVAPAAAGAATNAPLSSEPVAAASTMTAAGGHGPGGDRDAGPLAECVHEWRRADAIAALRRKMAGDTQALAQRQRDARQRTAQLRAERAAAEAAVAKATAALASDNLAFEQADAQLAAAQAAAAAAEDDVSGMREQIGAVEPVLYEMYGEDLGADLGGEGLEGWESGNSSSGSEDGDDSGDGGHDGGGGGGDGDSGGRDDNFGNHTGGGASSGSGAGPAAAAALCGKGQGTAVVTAALLTDVLIWMAKETERASQIALPHCELARLTAAAASDFAAADFPFASFSTSLSDDSPVSPRRRTNKEQPHRVAPDTKFSALAASSSLGALLKVTCLDDDAAIRIGGVGRDGVLVLLQWRPAWELSEAGGGGGDGAKFLVAATAAAATVAAAVPKMAAELVLSTTAAEMASNSTRLSLPAPLRRGVVKMMYSAVLYHAMEIASDMSPAALAAFRADVLEGGAKPTLLQVVAVESARNALSEILRQAPASLLVENDATSRACGRGGAGERVGSGASIDGCGNDDEAEGKDLEAALQKQAVCAAAAQAGIERLAGVNCLLEALYDAPWGAPPELSSADADTTLVQPPPMVRVAAAQLCLQLSTGRELSPASAAAAAAAYLCAVLGGRCGGYSLAGNDGGEPLGGQMSRQTAVGGGSEGSHSTADPSTPGGLRKAVDQLCSAVAAAGSSVSVGGDDAGHLVGVATALLPWVARLAAMRELAAVAAVQTVAPARKGADDTIFLEEARQVQLLLENELAGCDATFDATMEALRAAATPMANSAATAAGPAGPAAASAALPAAGRTAAVGEHRLWGSDALAKVVALLSTPAASDVRRVPGTSHLDVLLALGSALPAKRPVHEGSINGSVGPGQAASAVAAAGGGSSGLARTLPPFTPSTLASSPPPQATPAVAAPPVVAVATVVTAVLGTNIKGPPLLAAAISPKPALLPLLPPTIARPPPLTLGPLDGRPAGTAAALATKATNDNQARSADAAASPVCPSSGGGTDRAGRQEPTAGRRGATSKRGTAVGSSSPHRRRGGSGADASPDEATQLVRWLLASPAPLPPALRVVLREAELRLNRSRNGSDAAVETNDLRRDLAVLHDLCEQLQQQQQLLWQPLQAPTAPNPAQLSAKPAAAGGNGAEAAGSAVDARPQWSLSKVSAASAAATPGSTTDAAGKDGGRSRVGTDAATHAEPSAAAAATAAHLPSKDKAALIADIGRLTAELARIEFQPGEADRARDVKRRAGVLQAMAVMRQAGGASKAAHSSIVIAGGGRGGGGGGGLASPTAESAVASISAMTEAQLRDEAATAERHHAAAAAELAALAQEETAVRDGTAAATAAAAAADALAARLARERQKSGTAEQEATRRTKALQHQLRRRRDELKALMEQMRDLRGGRGPGGNLETLWMTDEERAALVAAVRRLRQKAQVAVRALADLRCRWDGFRGRNGLRPGITAVQALQEMRQAGRRGGGGGDGSDGEGHRDGGAGGGGGGGSSGGNGGSGSLLINSLKAAAFRRAGMADGSSGKLAGTVCDNPFSLKSTHRHAAAGANRGRPVSGFDRAAAAAYRLHTQPENGWRRRSRPPVRNETTARASAAAFGDAPFLLVIPTAPLKGSVTTERSAAPAAEGVGVALATATTAAAAGAVVAAVTGATTWPGLVHSIRPQASSTTAPPEAQQHFLRMAGVAR